MKFADEGDPGPVDPELTEILPLPGAVDEPDDELIYDDEEVDTVDEPVSPLVRTWRRMTGWLPEEGKARHLTYAGAAAAVVVALIGVLIVAGSGPEGSDEVADAANSEMTDLEGTQSYDDYSQLVPSTYDTTSSAFPTETTPVIEETPLDVPPPGDDPLIEFSDTGVPYAPTEITVTETADSADDPYATETETVVETPTETITPAPTESGTQWPNVSLNGSVSVQVPTRQPSDNGSPPSPSTVTVTVEVPARTTTNPTRSRTTTPQPTTCVSTPSTTHKPKPTTTLSKTTTRTAKPTTTSPRPKPSTTTPKKTTAVPSCR